MNSNIMKLARCTESFLNNYDLREEKGIVEKARESLEASIYELTKLQLDDLCAIADENRHELTTRQQNIIECYARLKRTLLEVHRDIFKTIKEKL